WHRGGASPCSGRSVLCELTRGLIRVLQHPISARTKTATAKAVAAILGANPSYDIDAATRTMKVPSDAAAKLMVAWVTMAAVVLPVRQRITPNSRPRQPVATARGQPKPR